MLRIIAAALLLCNASLCLALDDSQEPGSSQIFNNHIPIDPQLSGSTSISKTTPLLDVTRAQSNLATQRAAIPSFEADLNAAKNRMAILLGMPPGRPCCWPGWPCCWPGWPCC